MSSKNESKLASAGIVVFDFDHSLINVNSDTHVFRDLADDLHRDMRTIRKQNPRLSVWTDLMDYLFAELHSRGVTEEEIVASMRGIPVDKQLAQTIKDMSGLGFSIHILSDANTVFIREVLRANGILSCVEAIHTNPARFHEGRLAVQYYHQDDHGCPLCPRNLCKGRVLERIVTDHTRVQLARSHPPNVQRSQVQQQDQPSNLQDTQQQHSQTHKRKLSTRILYVGDGSGDYCPSKWLYRTHSIVATPYGPDGRWEMEVRGSEDEQKMSKNGRGSSGGSGGSGSGSGSGSGENKTKKQDNDSGDGGRSSGLQVHNELTDHCVCARTRKGNQESQGSEYKLVQLVTALTEKLAKDKSPALDQVALRKWRDYTQLAKILRAWGGLDGE